MYKRCTPYVYILRTLIVRTFDLFFICYWVCWLVIRITRALRMPLPILNNWLADIVFVPIIVHISLVLSSIIIAKDSAKGYSLWQILLVCLLVSLVYELILPAKTIHTRADYADVFAYFAGGLFYYHYHQKRFLKYLQKSPERWSPRISSATLQ